MGGQASTFTVGGGQLERGYHHLFVSDVAMTELIHELGLGDKLAWLESKVGLYHGGTIWSFSTPMDLLREVQAIDSNEGARFVETMRAFRPRVIVNEVRTADDIKLGFSIASVCRKYFGIDAEYLGYVNHDEAARRSVRARRPIVASHPRSDASIYIARIARKLAAAHPPPAPAATPV